ncbi:MAG: excinuclease ABC subunit UvrC [Pseudomonadales bacterium]|jgi:excinuclease ABC subunit C|nr:excinuclease ABC subunit UvrC [Pseudomonadales bacterium]
MTATDFDSEHFLKNLTRKPGVYRMLDVQGKVLYVGKARNLKNRVSSYFRASGLATKTMAMVAKIHRIETTVTKSETEALLLEQSLIKTDRPPYNILLRDDKSYPFVHISTQDGFPRLSFHRGLKKGAGKYFGPFPSAAAVRDSLNVLQRLFMVRQCEDSYFKNRSRPCLQHQIRRCSAPCVGLVSKEDYAEDVELAILFLQGKSIDVLDQFKTKMDAAASALDYERAAKYRDQILQLRKIQERQYVHGDAGDVDVFGYAEEGGQNCVQGVFIRAGRVLGQRTYYNKNDLSLTAGEFLQAFVAQYYFASVQRDIPKSILVSELSSDHDALAQALNDKAGRNVQLTQDVRGQRARWLSLARDNAKLNLRSHLADKSHMLARFQNLQDAVGLDEMPQRLECFDISHTMGEATVASCVVFDTSGPQNSLYRRFNIDGITGGDDYAAMEQALRRRYTRLIKGEGEMPDLLIIDGGLGQVRRALAVLAELQIDSVKTLGIAKGVERISGEERFFLGETEIVIDGRSEAGHLLQHIRDEAHRFAITGHRAQRGKKRRQSELEQIAGVGPKRRRQLLLHFGSPAGVRGASVEELAKVPGISGNIADQIYSALHE